MKKEKGRCQYCKKEFDSDNHKRTTEHIIPKGIIDLYPDQYIAFKDGQQFIDNKGATIGDVCQKCNGVQLSRLDSYGKDLISNSFLEEIPVAFKDNDFTKEIDYFQLSRWLLKVLYNHTRSKKASTEWFEKALGFMLNDLRVENIDFSIFMGIHVNTTPFPEQFYTYKPMQIIDNPKLLGSSLCLVSFGIDPFKNSLDVVQGAFSTHVIRFGTAIFYVVLWENHTSLIVKKFLNTLMTNEFAFTQIVSRKPHYCLKRVSAHSNTTIGYSHLISISGMQQDDMIVQDSVHGKNLSECQAELLEWKGIEGIEETRALIEMMEFPGNTRARRKFEKYFGKEIEENAN